MDALNKAANTCIKSHHNICKIQENCVFWYSVRVELKQSFPSATLHVYYGKELCPYEFQKEITMLLQQVKDVFEHGKVELVETFKARWSSMYHVYITEFQEIDCLSIRESVAAGCIPIVANHAVFKERPAALVDFQDKESVWDQMVGLIQKLESEPSLKESLRNALQKRLQDEKLDIEWKGVAQEWSTFFS